MVAKIAIVLVVLGSVALGCAGLISGHFGYIKVQDTCWITSKDEDALSSYKLQLVLLYGPVFACLLCNFCAVAYILIELRRLRASNRLGSRKIRYLVFRMAFSPVFLIVHCLMVIGGDLPITYHSNAAQVTSYLANYLGFSCYALALSSCAVFLDPAFRNMRRSYMNRTSDGASDEEVNHELACDVSLDEVVVAMTEQNKDAFQAKDRSHAYTGKAVYEVKDHTDMSRTMRFGSIDKHVMIEHEQQEIDPETEMIR